MQSLSKGIRFGSSRRQLVCRNEYVGFVKFVISVLDCARSQTVAVSRQGRGDRIVLFFPISRVVIRKLKEPGFARNAL
jgi:hypothetical protein